MTEIIDQIIAAAQALAHLPLPKGAALNVRYDQHYAATPGSTHATIHFRHSTGSRTVVELLDALGPTLEFEETKGVPRWADAWVDGIQVTVHLTWRPEIDGVIVTEYHNRHGIEGA